MAGEFLVAGELSRRGYPVSITMGNAKAVDIHADTQQETIRVDVKATASKTSWPIKENSVNKNIYYIFVYLQDKAKIKANTAPEYFILRGEEIHSKKLVKPWRSMPSIPYAALNTDEYKEKWNKLPLPPS